LRHGTGVSQPLRVVAVVMDLPACFLAVVAQQNDARGSGLDGECNRTRAAVAERPVRLVEPRDSLARKVVGAE
jgi:hypothetical protein